MTSDGAPKLILVLGAGQYYVRVIERLQNSGFRTLVVDRNSDAPGLRVGNLSYPIDIADRTAVLALARELEIDGVLPLNDFGVRTAAHISHEMGLPGLSPTTAELANDKGRMRQRWERDQLPNPDFRVVGSATEARAAYRELGPPLVVKPTDAGGGGRGVSIVRSEHDLDWSYDFASPFASNGRIIVERFVDGLEVTVETISQHGQVHVLTMSDKVKLELRTPVATSLKLPRSAAGSRPRRSRLGSGSCGVERRPRGRACTCRDHRVRGKTRSRRDGSARGRRSHLLDDRRSGHRHRHGGPKCTSARWGDCRSQEHPPPGLCLPALLAPAGGYPVHRGRRRGSLHAGSDRSRHHPGPGRRSRGYGQQLAALRIRRRSRTDARGCDRTSRRGM